jgi:SAM-dependent methyltransferase
MNTDMDTDTTNTIATAPENVGQLQAWDGGEGAYWAANADAYDAAVLGYHPDLLAAASLGPDDRVLDVGCGAGQTTIDAARVAATALGVDLSSAMLEVARRRASDAGLTNADFLQADAQIHPFESAGFDVLVSRTGAMFFSDQEAAFANLARAVRDSGRLALLVWQPVPRNEWFLAFTTALAAGRNLPGPPPGAPSPFSLSDPDHTRGLLNRTGWSEVDFEGLERPMLFGADADTAHAFVLGQLGWLVADLPDEQRTRAVDALHQVMREHETPDGVLLGSAAWLVTARRD